MSDFKNHDLKHTAEPDDDHDVRSWLGEFLPGESPSESFADSLRATLLDERVPSDGDLATIDVVAVSHSTRKSSWRRLSLGMVAAAAAVAAMIFWPAPVAYSFETMRAKLSEQEFVRANLVGQAASIVGWVSGVGQFAAVEAADSVSVSVRGNRVVQYTRRGGTVQYAASGMDAGDGASSRLLQILGAVQANASSGLSIASESWRRVTRDQNVDIELDVIFRDAGATEASIPVRFGIDSESGLPQWMQLLGAGKTDPATLSLRYPATGPRDLSSLGIPNHLAAIAQSGLIPGTDAVGSSGLEQPEDEPNDLASLISPSREVPPAREMATPDRTDSDETDADVHRIVANATDPNADGQPLVSTSPSVRVWEPPLAVSVPRTIDAMTKQIDTQLRAVWRERGLSGQQPADAHTLYRRLHLDLTGRIPRVAEIREQVTEAALSVESVVDALLDSPDFDSNMAAVWTSWLLPPDVELDQFGGQPAFMAWLSDQFAGHVAYDEIVRELLTAEGRVGSAGPVLFTTALEMKADHLAKQTARTFLGTRIDCAMCHDHPYDAWTQTDFWGYAALFARISRPEGKMNAMSSVLRVKDVGIGEVYLPDTEVVVAPKLLGGPMLVEQPESSERRRRLAVWLTDPSNRQFARATVNLVWSHFFGAGLVEPRDDFGVHNTAISPELLEQLAAFFIENEFNVRTLVRAIVQTDAYAQSSVTEASNDRPMFNSMPIRWLNAGQLYDCLQVASGGFSQQTIEADPNLGLQRISNFNRDQFIEQFGGSLASVLEYESGIPQALSLMNGPLANLSAGEDSSRLLKGLQAPFFTDRDRVETVFLSLVGRPPSNDETKVIDDMIASSPETPVLVVLSDLVWALLNSAEFATNH